MQGAIRARAHRRRHIVRPHDRIRRGGGGDDDVYLARRHPVTRSHGTTLAMDAVGEFAAALRVAIGDQDAPGVVLVQIPGGALAHLPRAEDERRRVCRRGGLQGNRRAGVADRDAPVQRRLAMDALGSVHRPLKERGEHRPRRACRSRGGVGIAHLPENLAVSQHRRGQPRRQREEMIDHILIAAIDEMRHERLGRNQHARRSGSE